MLRSLRARAALGAVVAVGLALVAGSVAMVLLVRSSLVGNVREAAELRAEDVAAALAEGGTAPGDLVVEDEDDGLIQVIADGRVIASSPNVEGLEPVADLEDEESTVLDDAPVGDDRFVAVAVDAGTDERGAAGGGDVVVLVARALDDVDETVAALVLVLVLGVPALLMVVGVVAWRLVGRALAPVGAMTATADEIGATDPGRRLPEPDSGDEVARLARTLNAMLGRLAESRERLSRFVADAAHELRSPVSSVRQHAEVALEHPDQVPVGELARVVQAEALRLQHLVDDLLLLARSDAGPPARSATAVDLDDLVAAAVDRLRPAADEAGVGIDTAAVSGGQVRGDPNALERLVANVVENAVHHADHQVAVALVEADDGAVELTVDDDGPGIPADQRARVFERFVRLDESRSRDAGGSGLGLAIVHAVAEAHGATVAIGDSPLGGARVVLVVLPPSD